jgi:hypothetical protein
VCGAVTPEQLNSLPFYQKTLEEVHIYTFVLFPGQICCIKQALYLFWRKQMVPAVYQLPQLRLPLCEREGKKQEKRLYMLVAAAVVFFFFFSNNLLSSRRCHLAPYTKRND